MLLCLKYTSKDLLEQTGVCRVIKLHKLPNCEKYNLIDFLYNDWG